MVLWEFKLKTREYFRENFVAHMNLMVERCFGEGGAAGGCGKGIAESEWVLSVIVYVPRI